MVTSRFTKLAPRRAGLLVSKELVSSFNFNSTTQQTEVGQGHKANGYGPAKLATNGKSNVNVFKLSNVSDVLSTTTHSSSVQVLNFFKPRKLKG